MLKTGRKISFLFILTGCIALCCGIGQAAQNNGVPETVMYDGTQYIHCRPAEGYPFVTTEKTVMVTGTPTEKLGTRMEPWRGLSLGESMLFTANDGAMLYCREMAGKRITVKGYWGTGTVVMKNVMTQKQHSILFKDALFVTEITGWTLLTGYPVSEDTGVADQEPSFFWMETNKMPN